MMTSGLISSILTVTFVSSSILPLKFQFGDKSPTLRGVSQCAGHENDAMVLIEGSTPETICMPGSTEMNVHTRMSEDLPMDLMLNLELSKTTPFPMHVPCMNGVGSCEYELCPMLQGMGDDFCDNFPPEQPCGCPFLKGDLELSGIQLPVQDMGPVLGAVMQGKYKATATMYGASNKDRILGCVEFTFELETC